MNQRKKGIIISYIYTAVHIIVNMLYVPILLSEIGKNEYGLYQLVGSLISYISMMESLLSTGVLRYYCKYNSLPDEKRKENVLAISKRIYYILSVIVAIVGIICVALFKQVYKDSLASNEISEAMVMILMFMVIIIINLTNSIYTASITANERFVFIKLLSIVTTILQPVIVLMFIKKMPYAVTVVSIQLFMTFVVAIVRSYYSKIKLKVKIKYHEKDTEFVKSLFSLSLSVLLVLIADQIFWKADQLIIGKILGTGAVAVYAVGAQIYLNYSPIGTSIAGVFMPRLSSLIDRDHDIKEVSKLFIRVGRISFLLLAAVLGGFSLYGKEFISLWAGEGYTDAYYIAIIIMIPLTVDVMQNMGLSILQITGKYSFRGKVYLTIAVVNIISTIFLVNMFGIVGAAVSTSISMALGNGFIMNVYYSRNVGLNIKEFWKEIISILPGVFIGMAVGIAVYQIHIKNAYLQFAVHILLFVMAYVLSVYKISMNKYEKGLVNSGIRKLQMIKVKK